MDFTGLSFSRCQSGSRLHLPSSNPCLLRRSCSWSKSRWPGFARLHIQDAEIPFSNATVELDVAFDRNLGTVQQSDVSAEEWDEQLRVLACETQAEIILICSFEKERAFFREEERETSQIDLPRIDFGLGKVGVGREYCYQLWGNLPGNFATDSSLPCS